MDSLRHKNWYRDNRYTSPKGMSWYGYNSALLRRYSKELILSKFEKFGDEHDKYMDKLEGTVHHMTRIILGRSDR